MSKKKLLIVVDWFVPGYKAGGPIQSCLNLAFVLKDFYDIYIFTTDTDHGETQPYKDILSNQWITNIHPLIKIYYAKKNGLTLKHIRKIITGVDADFVYLNHLYSPYFAVYPLWLKYTGILKNKVVLCPRGAVYDNSITIKPYKKKPYLFLLKKLNIHKYIRFHATNEREKQAIEYFFPGSKTIIADNLPNFNQPQFISCEKKPGSIKCIFVSRIVPIKNLLFLLNVLEKVKTSVTLTVVGPDEDKGYWNECEKKIKQLPGNIKIDYVGTRRNSELLDIIKEHHLFVLPTTGENFGHAIFEALSVGRPVLISDQTPWLNLPDYKVGWDVPLNQPATFTKIIEDVAGWDQQQFDETAYAAWQYAKKFIENPALKQQYFKLFS